LRILTAPNYWTIFPMLGRSWPHSWFVTTRETDCQLSRSRDRPRDTKIPGAFAIRRTRWFRAAARFVPYPDIGIRWFIEIISLFRVLHALQRISGIRLSRISE
jgi:hypothetical protein